MLASLTGPLGIPTQDLWYASRGSGLVLLVLLSASVVLGILVRSGWAPFASKRFVVEGIHRNLALLSVAVVVVHVVSAELDPYVTIGWAAAFVPLTSPYRPVWIALGAGALDVLIAVIATSLFRRFLGYRAWRAVHLLSYAAWPAAFVHSLESGTDTSIGWVLWTMWACAGAVALAGAARLIAEKPAGRWSRRATSDPGPAPATVAPSITRGATDAPRDLVRPARR